MSGVQLLLWLWLLMVEVCVGRMTDASNRGSSFYYTFHSDASCLRPAFDYALPSLTLSNGSSTLLNQCQVLPNAQTRRKLVCVMGDKMFSLMSVTYNLLDTSCSGPALSKRRALHRDICAWDFARIGNSRVHCGDDSALVAMQQSRSYLSTSTYTDSKCSKGAKLTRLYISTCTPVFKAKHLGTAYDVERNFLVTNTQVVGDSILLSVSEYDASDTRCVRAVQNYRTISYYAPRGFDNSSCLRDPTGYSNLFYSTSSGGGFPGLVNTPTHKPTPVPTAIPTVPTAIPTARPTPVPTISPGTVTSLGTSASPVFNQPLCVALDSTGNVYVGEYAGQRIRRIDATTGVLTSLGTSASPQLDNIGGVAVDISGNVYVTEFDVSRVRKIDTSGVVTSLGTSASPAWNRPYGLAVDGSGLYLYVADFSSGTIRRLTFSSGVVTNLGTSATYGGPMGVAVDTSGSFVYVGEFSGNKVAKINVATGAVTYLATSAGWFQPRGVAVDSLGNVFVCDQGNKLIRRIDVATGVVTSLGTSASPAWNSPFFLALDSSSNVYVTEFDDARVRKISGPGPTSAPTAQPL